MDNSTFDLAHYFDLLTQAALKDDDVEVKKLQNEAEKQMVAYITSSENPVERSLRAEEVLTQIERGVVELSHAVLKNHYICPIKKTKL